VPASCRVRKSVVVDWSSFGATAEELKKFGLPDELLLRTCVDFDEGVLVGTYWEPLGSKAYLVVCNLNELICRFWGDDPRGILAVLRRAVEDQTPAARELSLLVRFILGEDVEIGELAGAMRKHAVDVGSILGLLDALGGALGEEDFQKLRGLLEKVVEKSFLTWDRGEAYLGVHRSKRNSLLPDNVAGAILTTYFYPKRESRGMLGKFGGSLYLTMFRSEEVFEKAVKMLKEASFRPHDVIYVFKRFDELGEFTSLTREDVLKLLEAFIAVVTESHKRGSVASKTVRLGDGRKLHVIVPRKQNLLDKFDDAILLLSNHEIKATFLKDFTDSGYIEDNDEAVKHIARMKEEDLAKLDKETLDSVLELLVQRATETLVQRA